MIVSTIVHGLGWASTYALIAVGFSLIFSASRIINLAQGEFVMLGGLIGFTLYALGIPLFLIPLFSALSVAAVGALVERAAIFPAREASATSLIIITIASSIVLRSGAALAWGPSSFRIPGFFRGAFVNLYGLIVDPQYLLIMGICAVSVVFLTLFLKKTKLGRSLRACSMDPVGARIVGISPDKMRNISFIISGGLAGLIGALIAPVFYASSECGLNLGLKGFCAAVLGGMGSIPGAIAGGLIIGLAEAFGANIASSYKDVIAPVLMIIVLYVRPRGIMGGRS